MIWYTEPLMLFGMGKREEDAHASALANFRVNGWRMPDKRLSHFNAKVSRNRLELLHSNTCISNSLVL